MDVLILAQVFATFFTFFSVHLLHDPHGVERLSMLSGIHLLPAVDTLRITYHAASRATSKYIQLLLPLPLPASTLNKRRLISSHPACSLADRDAILNAFDIGTVHNSSFAFGVESDVLPVCEPVEYSTLLEHRGQRLLVSRAAYTRIAPGLVLAALAVLMACLFGLSLYGKSRRAKARAGGPLLPLTAAHGSPFDLTAIAELGWGTKDIEYTDGTELAYSQPQWHVWDWNRGFSLSRFYVNIESGDVAFRVDSDNEALLSDQEDLLAGLDDEPGKDTLHRKKEADGESRIVTYSGVSGGDAGRRKSQTLKNGGVVSRKRQKYMKFHPDFEYGYDRRFERTFIASMASRRPPKLSQYTFDFEYGRGHKDKHLLIESVASTHPSFSRHSHEPHKEHGSRKTTTGLEVLRHPSRDSHVVHVEGGTAQTERREKEKKKRARVKVKVKVKLKNAKEEEPRQASLASTGVRVEECKDSVVSTPALIPGNMNDRNADSVALALQRAFSPAKLFLQELDERVSMRIASGSVPEVCAQNVVRAEKLSTDAEKNKNNSNQSRELGLTSKTLVGSSTSALVASPSAVYLPTKSAADLACRSPLPGLRTQTRKASPVSTSDISTHNVEHVPSSGMSLAVEGPGDRLEVDVNRVLKDVAFEGDIGSSLNRGGEVSKSKCAVERRVTRNDGLGRWRARVDMLMRELREDVLDAPSASSSTAGDINDVAFPGASVQTLEVTPDAYEVGQLSSLSTSATMGSATYLADDVAKPARSRPTGDIARTRVESKLDLARARVRASRLVPTRSLAGDVSKSGAVEDTDVRGVDVSLLATMGSATYLADAAVDRRGVLSDALPARSPLQCEDGGWNWDAIWAQREVAALLDVSDTGAMVAGGTIASVERFTTNSVADAARAATTHVTMIATTDSTADSDGTARSGARPISRTQSLVGPLEKDNTPFDITKSMAGSYSGFCFGMESTGVGIGNAASTPYRTSEWALRPRPAIDVENSPSCSRDASICGPDRGRESSGLDLVGFGDNEKSKLAFSNDNLECHLPAADSDVTDENCVPSLPSSPSSNDLDRNLPDIAISIYDVDFDKVSEGEREGNDTVGTSFCPLSSLIDYEESGIALPEDDGELFEAGADESCMKLECGLGDSEERTSAVADPVLSDVSGNSSGKVGSEDNQEEGEGSTKLVIDTGTVSGNDSGSGSSSADGFGTVSENGEQSQIHEDNAKNSAVCFWPTEELVDNTLSVLYKVSDNLGSVEAEVELLEDALDGIQDALNALLAVSSLAEETYVEASTSTSGLVLIKGNEEGSNLMAVDEELGLLAQHSIQTGISTSSMAEFKEDLVGAVAAKYVDASTSTTTFEQDSPAKPRVFLDASTTPTVGERTLIEASTSTPALVERAFVNTSTSVSDLVLSDASLTNRASVIRSFVEASTSTRSLAQGDGQSTDTRLDVAASTLDLAAREEGYLGAAASILVFEQSEILGEPTSMSPASTSRSEDPKINSVAIPPLLAAISEEDLSASTDSWSAGKDRPLASASNTSSPCQREDGDAALVSALNTEDDLHFRARERGKGADFGNALTIGDGVERAPLETCLLPVQFLAMTPITASPTPIPRRACGTRISRLMALFQQDNCTPTPGSRIVPRSARMRTQSAPVGTEANLVHASPTPGPSGSGTSEVVETPECQSVAGLRQYFEERGLRATESTPSTPSVQSSSFVPKTGFYVRRDGVLTRMALRPGFSDELGEDRAQGMKTEERLPEAIRAVIRRHRDRMVINST